MNWKKIFKGDFPNKKNEITLELHETIKEFLLDLDQKSRAIFQLGYALTFKHKYSPDLYAFSASIKDFMIKKGTMYKMTIEDAMNRFGSGRYKKPYDWKRKVLEPSMNEINEKTDLNLHVEFLNKDKHYRTKITHVLFGVTRKVGEDLMKVRMNVLGIDKMRSLQEEASEWAEGYIEEYAVNELGFDPDGYDKDEILSAMNIYEQKMKQKRGA